MNINEIADFLVSRAHIPVIEAAKFATRIRVRTFTENENIFSQGELGKSTYILLSGLCYVFYLHVDGREKVKRFVSRGDTLSPYISILTGEPSKYSARVLKKVTCLEFLYSDYIQLVSKSWMMEKGLRKELEFQIIEREKKEYELFMLSAEERYQSFLDRHKQHINDIPLKLIASYINIDPASLSRIRRN